MEPTESSLLQQVAAQRAKEREEDARKKAEEKDIKEAQKAVPELQKRLGTLITTHITQEERTVPFEVRVRAAVMGELDEPTKLTAHIDYPGEDKQIWVSITSNQYPKNDEDNQSAHYTIDVGELDYTLNLGFEGKVVSKQRRISRPPGEPRIGARYPSFPAWERPMTNTDVQNYSSLLEVLETGEHVTFEGSTPVHLAVDPATHPDNRKDVHGQPR